MAPRSTPRARRRAQSSPDPLAAPLEPQERIDASPVPSSMARRTRANYTPTKAQTPTPRKSRAVASGSAKKRTRGDEERAESDQALVDGEANKVDLAQGLGDEDDIPTGSTSRHTPAKRPKVQSSVSRKGKERATDEDPPQISTASPRRSRPTQSQTTITPRPAQATSTPRASARKTLGSAIKPLPTPPPSSGREPEVGMRHFDEAFGDPFGSGQANEYGETGSGRGKGRGKGKGKGREDDVSRDVFLANEALKRQREARNFRYEGDVDAPALTRSGRVIGRRVGRGDEEAEEGAGGGEGGDGDGYGGDAAGGDVDVEMDGDGNVEMEEGDGGLDGEIANPNTPFPMEPLDPLNPTQTTINPNPNSNPALSDMPTPLPPGARSHILRILSTLTGANNGAQGIEEEETNEALVGLGNLLRGTVERGEGNSALVVGPRGSGKSMTISRALSLIPSTPSTSPIIVRLSGHAQTNDRLAIREMGRQISEAEGLKSDLDAEEDEGEGNGELDADNDEYAPTTLPSHLLALLTAPSARAIIVIIDEFDLFTEHARQALLYCLLDVVQSVKTGPVESTGRGVAVIGLTSRIDTLLLLEKRVKSRFSHRVWRTISPLAPGGLGWKSLLKSVLLPPSLPTSQAGIVISGAAGPPAKKGKGKMNGKKQVVEVVGTDLERWLLDWQYAVEGLLDHEDVINSLDRLVGLTTDVRNLYRPFIISLSQIASGQIDFIYAQTLTSSILAQLSLAGWSGPESKLKGLPQPELALLVISKHLGYAGREEFNYRQVEEEYLRFARTRLVGSGRVRWPVAVLRGAFDQLLHLGLLVPIGPSASSLKSQFAKVRCTLSPHEIVAWFKGEGANTLSTELANWGRMMGGHA